MTESDQETPEIDLVVVDEMDSQTTMLRKILASLNHEPDNPKSYGTVYNGPKQRNDGHDAARLARAAAKRARRAR